MEESPYRSPALVPPRPRVPERIRRIVRRPTTVRHPILGGALIAIVALAFLPITLFFGLAFLARWFVGPRLFRDSKLIASSSWYLEWVIARGNEGSARNRARLEPAPPPVDGTAAEAARRGG